MKEELKKEGIEWVKAFAIGIIIFAFIRTFFFSNYIVEGESMMPTLEDGNKLVVNKIGYQIGDLNRFDVIVFHANQDEDFVKRIIGLPGDEIEYKQDHLYVNGKKMAEPFLEIYREQTLGGAINRGFHPKGNNGKKRSSKGEVICVRRQPSWQLG